MVKNVRSVVNLGFIEIEFVHSYIIMNIAHKSFSVHTHLS